MSHGSSNTGMEEEDAADDLTFTNIIPILQQQQGDDRNNNIENDEGGTTNMMMNSSDDDNDDEAWMDDEQPDFSSQPQQQQQQVIHHDDEVVISSSSLSTPQSSSPLLGQIDDGDNGNISSSVTTAADDDDGGGDGDNDTTAGPISKTQQGKASAFPLSSSSSTTLGAAADSSHEESLIIPTTHHPQQTSFTTTCSYATVPHSSATFVFDDPPPPPPPTSSSPLSPRAVSISSPKVSSNQRRSSLRTVHSGRSLHSDESKSNLAVSLSAAISATATSSASALSTATADAAPQNTSSGISTSGSGLITSRASFKKPGYRNFLQRTQAVRPRYNPNRNSSDDDSGNNSATSSIVDVPLHHQHLQQQHHAVAKGAAAAALLHRTSTPHSAASSASAVPRGSPPQHYQQQQHHHPSIPTNTHHHHTTSNSKAALLASRLARRGHVFKQRLLVNSSSDMDGEFTNSGLNGGGYTDSMFVVPLGGIPAAAAAAASMGTGSTAATTTTPTTGLRRKYQMGDQVLVCNHQSRWANLVNRYGFPPRDGVTPEERRGPYLYVLAQVKSVHFEEYSVYYTVVRADTGAEQRADADFMEPLTNPRGQAAALRAATQPMEQDNAMNPEDYVPQQGDSQSKCMRILEEVCFVILCPFFWTWDLLRFVCVSYLCPLGRVTMQFLTGQSRLLLNGMEPYSCRLRCTTVNLCVFCSTWYMFIDQARLAFFPPTTDFALAVINLIVWLILIIELFCEVFIRADNYGELIVSEKAYSPTTVRYINSFHLIVESISLALFIPEFYCLFSSEYYCDDRIPFSFYNAALMSVTGPTQLQAFYGKAFFALIRLRVFGLVRHWKTMWIVNTFIHMKWKYNKSGLIANIVPSRASVTSRKSTSMHGSNHNNNGSCGGDGKSDDPNNDEAALTSASTIGTALMVTNSYRALAILWVITGLFPLISCLVTFSTNNVAPQLTRQLQATNLISNDTSNATCNFLTDSVISWASALRAPDFDDDPSDPYLLGLQIEPLRCYEPGEDILDHMCRPVLDATRSGLLHKLSGNDTEISDSVYVFLELCQNYRRTQGSSISEIAHELGLRPGSVLQFYQQDEAKMYPANNTAATIGFLTNYSVLATFDQTYSIEAAAVHSFLLQLVLLVSVLGGLSVLRRDAEVLVLGPLRRMLKIVARYAKNPLMPTKFKRRNHNRYSSSMNHRRIQRGASTGDIHSDASSCSTNSDDSDNDGEFSNNNDTLGSFETEQLITAVTKITDLLRKCWGVAGADIISTNLDSQEGLKQVFNPTVPGKKVYALFAFAAITDFAHAQRTLGGNVMILINHVAGVVHDEVFRWGFGDSGACNRNLGSAFLLVFRIGLVSEVQNKLKQAKDVLFNHGPKASQTKRPKKPLTGSTDSTATLAHSSATGSTLLSSAIKRSSSIRIHHHQQHNNSNNTGGKVVAGGGGGSPTHARRRSIPGTSKRTSFVSASSPSEKAMSLASLPGINAFTDRAVIGMLKSFAGIHRDKKIRDWNNSFELSAGVGTFTVSMIYGMDAGWAMEGAVGSEYKIDATYLSPHVNMASRMMSACKQYGVSILLSQAVQELMSDVARSKLRHLDTVTVKGSTMKQKIYTYDARHKGVDFFLYSKTDAQADEDANKYFETKIWNIDQDLRAMRQHVTEDFLKEFGHGRKAYLAGDWPMAMKRLERANEIMVETALEEGYLEDEFNAVFQQQQRALAAAGGGKSREGDASRAAAEELKVKNGDGPSLYLLNFMKSHGGVAPDRWEGWHPLMVK